MAIAIVASDYAARAVFPAAFPGSGQVPSPPWLVFNLAYGSLFAVLGGYIAAMLAKHAEIQHALALGGASMMLGLINLVNSLGRQPLWYLVALLVIVMPAVGLGGWLRARQLRKTRAQAGPGGLR